MHCIADFKHASLQSRLSQQDRLLHHHSARRDLAQDTIVEIFHKATNLAEGKKVYGFVNVLNKALVHVFLDNKSHCCSVVPCYLSLTGQILLSP